MKSARPAFGRKSWCRLAARILLGFFFLNLGSSTPFSQWALASAQNPGLESGLKVTFQSLTSSSGPSNDVVVLPNVALYLAPDQSPTPFLPPGQFSVTWDGFLSSELRGEYRFEIEFCGQFQIEINGTPILHGQATNLLSDLSPTVVWK